MFNYSKSARKAMLGLTLGAFATIGMAASTQAAEKINMIAIDGYPARAMWVKEFSGFFIPRVNEELKKSGNYEISWQAVSYTHLRAHET